MWHDDDGEDDPIPGPVPDPSARHWRHPSELARQHALPDPTPVPLSQPAASPSMGWPLTVIGGCIAVAALGVMALSLTRADQSAVTAGPGSAASVGAGLDLADGGRAGDITDIGPMAGLTTDEDDTATGAEPDDERIGRPDAEDDLSGGALGGQTTIPRAEDPDDVDEGTDPVPTALIGVYARLDRAEVPLASFVRAGDHLITSASSIGRRRTVWLRVGDNWSKSKVTATDPLTDVALLTPIDPDAVIDVPALEPGDDPVQEGAAAAVGYGVGVDTDGDGVEDTLVDSLVSDLPAVASGAVGGPETDDDSDGHSEGEGGDDHGYSIESRPVPSGEEAVEPKRSRGGGGGQATEAAPLEDEADHSDEAGDRWVDEGPNRGWIYSLRQPLRTLGGRVVYEPIRTGIDRVAGDGGAPLRSAEGHLIGLVLGADSPQVAALPIERAIEVAESLYRWGIGNLAWVGVETSPVDGGLRVVQVDENGPAADLEPGDVILAFDGTQVTHPDHFEHLVRQAGPGTTVGLTIDRRGRPTTLDIAVATYALP